MWIGAVTKESSMEVPQKIETVIHQFHFSVFKGNKTTNLKRYMYPSVHSSIIYNCQDTEAT